MPRILFKVGDLSVAAPAFLATALLLGPVAAGRAQEGPGGGGFFSRGIGGGGGPEREPGAYASPSGIPSASPGDIGVNLPEPMRRLEPIALPRQPGSGDDMELSLPALPAYAPTKLPGLDIQIPRAKPLHLDARLMDGGPEVPNGLVWRLFSPTVGPDGKLPLVASAEGGAVDFDVPPGPYLMHVGFGRAGVTRKIDVGLTPLHDSIVLHAGGLKMNAVVAGDHPIPADKLTFDIYSDEDNERDRRLIAEDVEPGTVVPINAGSYRIVSKYGSDNAEVGGEVKVDAGKVTDVTLQHRAAELTMKLVRETGGEAIADTAWQVMDADGGLIRESVSAFPSMVLAEGEYLVVAKNRDKTYQRDFTVSAGSNVDVELKTTDILPQADSVEGSGD
ncbi:collagen binding domain-containing protein [Aureimonas psammosilenae]|uniref:hypothetical protein n=1 Tax=Aureimonas psammosilenae TaxID=2495496 RepID=UPI001F41542F|nr:hypothetical protein [Aureimonas psammosilenae]